MVWSSQFLFLKSKVVAHRSLNTIWRESLRNETFDLNVIPNCITSLKVLFWAYSLIIKNNQKWILLGINTKDLKFGKNKIHQMSSLWY